MPAGMVRPLASQAPRLGLVALAEYARRGWRITEHGHADSGQTSGPCARCRTVSEVYGPAGNPLCATCQDQGPP